jgi:hypothetical protein
MIADDFWKDNKPAQITHKDEIVLTFPDNERVRIVYCDEDGRIWYDNVYKNDAFLEYLYCLIVQLKAS